MNMKQILMDDYGLPEWAAKAFAKKYNGSPRAIYLNWALEVRAAYALLP